MIDRFGAQAVYGRVLSVRELRALYLAERLVKAYRDHRNAPSAADWAETHPEEAGLLFRAMKENGRG